MSKKTFVLIIHANLMNGNYPCIMTLQHKSHLEVDRKDKWGRVGKKE